MIAISTDRVYPELAASAGTGWCAALVRLGVEPETDAIEIQVDDRGRVERQSG